MLPGEIYYLKTNGMFALQHGDLWIKVTNCPQTKDKSRPFVFLRDGRDSNWGIWAPYRSHANRHTITVPASKISYANNINRNQNIIYTQLWKIPNSFIRQQQGNIPVIDSTFFHTNVLPYCQPCIEKLVPSPSASS